MKKLLLGLIIVALTPFAQAQAEDFFPAAEDQIDEGQNPAEILEDLKYQQPEMFEENFQDLVIQTNGGAPRVYILVNKAPKAQYMHVYLNGQPYVTWKVSTGREKLETGSGSGRKYRSSTPIGSWVPRGTTRLHRSSLWDADMPYAIWLVGGIAIHAAAPKYESKLGQRASGGCIRLSYRNAEHLYALVNQYGLKNTLVRVVNE